jgi:hypothetical protein
MDLERGQNYLRQRRELDAQHDSLEPEIKIIAQDIEPAAFNTRVEGLIERFNNLPLSGEKDDNNGLGRSFTVVIPESSAGADDEAHLRFRVMDWDVIKSLSVSLYDSKTSIRGSLADTDKPLIEEKVIAHQAKQTPYSEEDFRHLCRLEQSMAIAEQAIAVSESLQP